MGALDGLVIADFSRVLAGPYCSMLLGDLGATVIKVERPGSGDDTRAWGPPFAGDGQSTYFDSVNRNKLSIALDLSDDADLALARRIAARSDVLLENFKPGGLAAYSLDYASVQALNPRIVYCSINGFGSDAGAELPGYDLLVQAMGGLMSITGDEVPAKAGVAVVDVLTGLHASVAILAALRHRDATGEGQEIEISLLGTLLSCLVNQSGAFAGAGVIPQRMGNAHPSIAPYADFATADRRIIIAVGNDGQFRRLAEAIGDPALAQDPDYATNPQRVAHRDALTRRLEIALSAHDADHWQAELMRVGVPAGPINDIGQAFATAQALGLHPIVEIDSNAQVANPVTYSNTPVDYRLAPPSVDADRAAVLALLEGSR